MKLTQPRGFPSLLGFACAAVLSLAFAPATANAGWVKYFNSGGTELAVSNVSLQDLLGGDYIEINNGYDTKKFSNFSGYTSTDFHGGPGANASLIAVTGLSDGGLDPGPGLKYNTGEWFVGANQQQDTSFSYVVSVLGPTSYRIHDNFLDVGAGQVGANNGQIRVLEQAVDPSPPNNAIATAKVLEINTAGVVSGATMDQIFYQPVMSVKIKKDIFLKGGTNDFTSITDMTQRYSQVLVPEPSTMAIAGLGMLGMVGFGLRRRRGA
jgi:hypothetical protein